MMAKEATWREASLQRSALQDHSRISCQSAQVLVRLWRIDERLDESAAPFSRKLDHFVHPNRLLRCGKHGAPNEVCRVTSAERRCPFDDRLLIRCEAELEPTIPCRACHSPRYLLNCLPSYCTALCRTKQGRWLSTLRPSGFASQHGGCAPCQQVSRRVALCYSNPVCRLPVSA